MVYIVRLEMSGDLMEAARISHGDNGISTTRRAREGQWEGSNMHRVTSTWLCSSKPKYLA
jgi:hypothetical protein